MKKFDWSGITPNVVARILILLVALVNVILQLFGINVLPITDMQINEIVSTVFLIGTTAYNVYKNFNVSTAAQKCQELITLLKHGEVAAEQVDEFIAQIKSTYNKDNVIE